MEVLFEFTLKKELTEAEQDKLWSDFIKFIESKGLLHGGGIESTHLKGGLYPAESTEKTYSELDLKTILKKFKRKHKNLIDKLTFVNNSKT